MTGRQAMQLFMRYGVLDYLEECYDVLHTTDREYLIEDIDLFIAARQSA